MSQLTCPDCGCSAQVRQNGAFCQCQRCYGEFHFTKAVQAAGPCKCKACAGGAAYKLQEARKGYKEALQAHQVGKVKLDVSRAVEKDMEAGLD